MNIGVSITFCDRIMMVLLQTGLKNKDFPENAIFQQRLQALGSAPSRNRAILVA